MPISGTNRRTFIATLGGAVAWPPAARGQQPEKPAVSILESSQLSLRHRSPEV
jgi:hypothetical protein